MDLTKKKCVPCEGKVPPLNAEQVGQFKSEVNSDWIVDENRKIRREFLFKNFRETMSFVNRIADLAEEEGHHPVMHVHYSKVDVEFWTHAINGLSENDFIMAAKVDLL